MTGNTELLTALKTITSVLNQNHMLTSEIDHIKEEIRALKDDAIESLREQNQKLIQKNSYLFERLQAIESKLEDYKVIMYGLEEDTSEDTTERVNVLFVEMLQLSSATDIIRNAYRIGKSSDKLRPIVVEFLTDALKTEVLNKAGKLKSKGITIYEDYQRTRSTPTTQTQLSRLDDDFVEPNYAGRWKKHRTDQEDELSNLTPEPERVFGRNKGDNGILSAKICHKCNEVIEGGVLTALGKSWHQNHFCCNECKQPITENKFHTNDGQPYCTPCHIKLFAKTCHACDQPILDKCVQALGANWHEDHFVCTDCKSKLVGTKFMQEAGIPFCQNCFLSKHADRCKACEKPIADTAVIALDAKWHPHCFKCSKCSKPIAKESFQVEAGLPKCVKC